MHTPSWGLYPQFDSKTLQYRELNKLTDFMTTNNKRFIELHAPWQGAEITLEEALQVPIPKNEDFAWENI